MKLAIKKQKNIENCLRRKGNSYTTRKSGPFCPFLGGGGVGTFPTIPRATKQIEELFLGNPGRDGYFYDFRGLFSFVRLISFKQGFV